MPDLPVPDVPAIPWPRLAVISHTHPSVSKGGAEIAAHALFRGLRGLGLDAIFIAACAQQDRRRVQLGSAHERVLFHDMPAYDHFYHAGSPALAREVAGMLATDQVGLANFHHFLFLGLGALRIPGVRTVLTLHEYVAICQHHGQMVTRPGRALCREASTEACANCFPEYDHTQFDLRRERFLAAFGAVDRFVSPSRFLADRYTAWGLPRSRISLIENGLYGLRAPSIGPRRRAEGTGWVFGYFGQINPYKGVDVLLQACEIIASRRRLADQVRIRIHGTVVGQPAFAERLAEAVAKYPFLAFPGPYVNNTVRTLMEECDYVLMPSTWWENSPVVIQEAFAARRPVICSGIGGMAEKVEDNVAGLHFRPGDAADLVHAMERAMDPELNARLTAGLPAASSEQDMARRYLECFAPLVWNA